MCHPKPAAVSVKIDALFKPLLRKFREYIREKFFQTYDKNVSHRMSLERKLKNIKSFIAKTLNLPKQLRTSLNMALLLTIVFSCTFEKDIPG